MADRKRLVLPAIVVGIAIVGAVLLLVTAPPVESEVPERTLLSVRVVEPSPKTVALRVRTQGTVAPRTESALIPQVSGPVVWVSPKLVSGGFFEVGEPLLRIDAQDYEAAVARARAALSRTRGEWSHASSERKRQEELSKRDIGSDSQLSNARRAARVGYANLSDARVALEQAERDLARTELLAPFAGRVREERVDVGQFVSRGESIATLYATDYAEIRLPVPDQQLAYLELPGLGRSSDEEGPAVTLRARFAGAEHSWQGRVVRTEGEIDPQSRMVHVIARVEAPYAPSETGRPPLAVGLFVRAEIDGRREDDVLVVPRVSLRDGDRMLVVDTEDRLQLRPAQVLRIDGDEVMLRARIASGERVVVSNLQTAVEGMQVRPLIEGPRS
ncbi:MAG: efflux RND transporter periplasmic adaptor subunit [Myxococcota bacterium]